MKNKRNGYETQDRQSMGYLCGMVIRDTNPVIAETVLLHCTVVVIQHLSPQLNRRV